MTTTERVQLVDYTFLNFPDTIMCQKLLQTSAELKLSRGMFGVPAVQHEVINYITILPFTAFLTWQFTGSQPGLDNNVCENGDNIDLAGSSTVSEVSQAEQTEERRTVEQRLGEYVSLSLHLIRKWKSISRII